MSASESHAPASGPCENCATDLQGEYCHHCGQRAHNPLRSFWHSVEDVFESFWHLDGRVFRTLKELLIPGRVASAYLAGHRVPYLPPLRLFVILAVFAFFVAQFAFHPNINIGDQSSFANDTTVAQVKQRRDKTLAELAQARAELEKSRYARAGAAGFLAGEDAVRESAVQRIAELQGKPAATDGDAAIADAGGDAIVETPTTVAWLPDVANRWLGHRIAMGKRNLIELKRNPETFTRALIHSVPTALFVLVPVFALLLKLFYLRSGRGYLEHLVVALYSHAFLCLALLGVFVLQIGGEHLPGGLVTLSGWLQALLWLWMAAYLWLTQLRVYAQGVFKTTLKYALLGSLYFWMVSFAAIILILLNLSRG